jgi:hypothetical protein
MKFNEKQYRSAVRPHLLRCRPGDWEHAQEAACWVKLLGKGRRDLPLILSAAYIHDLGWRDIFHTSRPIALQRILKYERRANRQSKPFVTAFLKNLDYTTPQIKTILRLIHAADQHRSRRPDEAVMVDADQLCKLSLRHIRNKFKQSDWPKLVAMWDERFRTSIRTKRGQAYVAPLLAKLKHQVG